MGPWVHRASHLSDRAALTTSDGDAIFAMHASAVTTAEHGSSSGSPHGFEGVVDQLIESPQRGQQGRVAA